MTRDEALAELRKLADRTNHRSLDAEVCHKLADDVLCELLVSLDMTDVVDEWRKVYKWYA